MEMKSYEMSDGHSTEIIKAISMKEAQVEADAWVKEGDYNNPTSTIWIDVRIVQIDEQGEPIGEREMTTVAIDPDEPTCPSGHGEHVWAAPWEIVGGLRGDPGVEGHGGGTVSTEVCLICGCGCTTDSWAQRPDTGEQGLHSLCYVEEEFDVTRVVEGVTHVAITWRERAYIVDIVEATMELAEAGDRVADAWDAFSVVGGKWVEEE